MSHPSSDDASAGLYRKPRADLYTVLLLAAFLALVIGTVFLYLDTADYGPTPAGEPNVQTGFYQTPPARTVAGAPTLATLAGRLRSWELDHG
jgi:hypothetical protein